MILARVRQDLPSFSFVSPIVPRFWWWLSRHALKTYLRMTLTSTRASFSLPLGFLFLVHHVLENDYLTVHRFFTR
jgi:hypothetical protein